MGGKLELKFLTSGWRQVNQSPGMRSLVESVTDEVYNKAKAPLASESADEVKKYRDTGDRIIKHIIEPGSSKYHRPIGVVATRAYYPEQAEKLRKYIEAAL